MSKKKSSKTNEVFFAKCPICGKDMVWIDGWVYHSTDKGNRPYSNCLLSTKHYGNYVSLEFTQKLWNDKNYAFFNGYLSIEEVEKLYKEFLESK